MSHAFETLFAQCMKAAPEQHAVAVRGPSCIYLTQSRIEAVMWTIVLIIVAILLPLLAVFLMSGLGRDFWINLILTVLFWVPGVIHALCLVLTRSPARA